MTVDPHLFFSLEADTLLKQEKRFFPSKIPVRHHQLRHIISSPSANVVYFASGNGKELYYINTKTRQRCRVGDLPFVPKCSATGYGWYCAGGGHKGDFVAVRIPHVSNSSLDRDKSDEMDDEGNPRQRRASESLFEYQMRLCRYAGLDGRVKRLGSDIVNSVSIHSIEGSRPDELDDVVAILTNNDRTVRVYSLSQDAEVSVLELPFSVNHASLSPDQKTIVAVGDIETMYFYRRIPTGYSTAGPTSSHPHYARHHWSCWTQVPLHKPKGQRCSAYFATAWSPNGRLCATASEDGYISILDMDKLEAKHEDEAVIAVIPSSRPQSPASDHFYCGPPGAVRTMVFSKEPWDLLFWTEGSGRLCVADVRNGLKHRQIISLESEAEGVTTIDLADDPSSNRRSTDEETLPPFTERHVRQWQTAMLAREGYSSIPRPNLQASDNPHARYFIDNTLGEASAASSLSERRPTPLSINYISGNVRSGASTPATDAGSTSSRQTSTSRNPHEAPIATWSSRAGRDLPRMSVWPESLPRFTPQSSTTDSSPRFAPQSATPGPPNWRPSWLYGPGSGNDPPRYPVQYHFPSLQSRSQPRHSTDLNIHQADTSNPLRDESESEAWRVVQPHLPDPRYAPLNDRDNPTNALSDLDADADLHLRPSDRLEQLSQRRAQLRSLAREQAIRMHPESLPGLRHAGRRSDAARWHAREDSPYEGAIEPDPRYGPLTTGIALDEDGETVYVGTHVGIWEVKINAIGRMTWGSIVPR